MDAFVRGRSWTGSGGTSAGVLKNMTPKGLGK
nr:MAG TPA: hypothetical protein [Caudoviricetes sp.]